MKSTKAWEGSWKCMIDSNVKYERNNKLLFITIIVLLPLMLLFCSINFVTYNIKNYEKQFERFSIMEEIGIDKNDLIVATQNLLNYIKNVREDLDFTALINGEEIEFFSINDKLHMIDVKNIFQAIIVAKNIGLILLMFIFFIIHFNNNVKIDIGKCLIISSVSGTLPFLMLMFLMYVDFNKYFTIFHKIFFRNDLWLLDPKTDRLVNIFPEEFFSNMAIKILSFYFIALAVILAIGIIILLKKQKKHI